MITYLACPYSNQDPAVREARFKAVNRAAAKLMKAGFHIFSPISHTHPIAVEGSLPTDFAYWEEYDRAILKSCVAMIVLKEPGWEESIGVRSEIMLAQDLDIPILLMEPV